MHTLPFIVIPNRSQGRKNGQDNAAPLDHAHFIDTSLKWLASFPGSPTGRTGAWERG